LAGIHGGVLDKEGRRGQYMEMVECFDSRGEGKEVVVVVVVGVVVVVVSTHVVEAEEIP